MIFLVKIIYFVKKASGFTVSSDKQIVKRLGSKVAIIIIQF